MEKLTKTLTGTGGLYEINKTLREKMVLLDDGTIVINENYKNDADVINKIVFFKNVITEDGKPLVRADKIKYDIPENIRTYYNENLRTVFIDNASQVQRDLADLIEVAYHKRASDIHIVVESPSTVIMFRVLGDLQVYKTLTYDEGNLMCTTLYNTMTTTSGTNFNARVQQDANIQEGFLPSDLSGIRVATGPTQAGNYFMVLRLLPKGSNNNIDDLGYSQNQLKMLRNFKSTHNGGITICSGPTGSGKSTLLQALTKEILFDSKGKINLITIEDPVEYPILAEDVVNGKTIYYTARQIAVPSTQDKQIRREYFNNAVIAAMRQDPDVILIGEIRDETTAQAAITASITGHPVLTTVHASNAIMILDRLQTIGANKKLLLTPGTITGLVSQSLVPVLCPKCKIPFEKHYPKLVQKKILGADLLERIRQVFGDDLSGIYLRGKGCEYHDTKLKRTCANGYINMTVVSEIVAPDEEFLQYARSDDLFGAHRYWIEQQEGITMMCHGLAKVKKGIIDPIALESRLKHITPQANLEKALLYV